ncbi:MAG: PspA/IM30 family protein [Pseudomonadota bacterium]|nr:PspA/IM30 family protein [Pseudomonadota bacterium]
MAELLKTLFKRIQDGASELGDAIHGDRIERDLDHDIRAIDLLLHQARNDAATIKAQRIASEDELKRTKIGITTLENDVADLLSRRRSSQARAKAAKAVALQVEHAALQRECKELKEKESEFNSLVAQLEHKLRRAKHQLGTLRAASGIQRAQAAVAKLQPGPATHPESAQASAQRARLRAVSIASGNSVGPAKSRGRRKPPASDADVAINALMDRLSPPTTPAAAPKRISRKPR